MRFICFGILNVAGVSICTANVDEDDETFFSPLNRFLALWTFGTELFGEMGIEVIVDGLVQFSCFGCRITYMWESKMAVYPCV